MRSSMLRRLSILVVVVALAACGGGDDARQVFESAATDAAVPATDSAPMDVDTSTTVASTAPPTSDAPAATPAPATGGDLDAYCGASARFFVEARALNEIGEDDDGAARMLFTGMDLSLSAALLNAPDDRSAEAPRRMAELFDVMLPTFDSIDYDPDRISTVDDVAGFTATLEEFDAIVDRLEQFLGETCGSDVEALLDDAARLAAEVGSGSNPPGPDTTLAPPPVDPTGYRDVSDDSGTVLASVPEAWVQVRGAPDGVLRQLVAAADIEAFLSSFSEPGMILAVGDAPAGNGAEAGRGALAGFQDAIVADGCSVNISAPYDDGLYVGEQVVYSCAGTDATTRAAAGTNAAGDVFWLLAVVTSAGDDIIWDTIAESFLVD